MLKQLGLNAWLRTVLSGFTIAIPERRSVGKGIVAGPATLERCGMFRKERKTMLALWIVWAALTLFVIGLAIARKITARNEDDLVHLAGGAERAISQQISVAQKLDWYDRWGKTLTVVDGVFGLVLVAIMLYMAWRDSLAVGG
jgi:hypothetical protein